MSALFQSGGKQGGQRAIVNLSKLLFYITGNILFEKADLEMGPFFFSLQLMQDGCINNKMYEVS